MSDWPIDTSWPIVCPGPIPPTSGPFAGMNLAQIQAALGQAQTALIALLTGGKPQMVSYGQGEGTKTVTFTRTNEVALRNLIAELNSALGQGRRRAVGVRFG